MNGALSWADGKYLDYQSVCYRGLAAPQCSNQVNRFTGLTGLYNDLSGTPLVRSPEWSGNIGADYIGPVGGGLKVGMSANFNFSSSFFVSNLSSPGAFQKPYQLVDATVRLMDQNDRWEVALIGRNLGDTHFFLRAADQPFAGSAPGLAPASSFLADTYSVLSRGREVMLRLTVNFGK